MPYLYISHKAVCVGGRGYRGGRFFSGLAAVWPFSAASGLAPLVLDRVPLGSYSIRIIPTVYKGGNPPSNV